MKNEFGSKKYYENYAKLTLAYIYDKKLINLEVEGKEEPDMQNEDLSLGIEVTRAINENIGVAASIINDYFGKNLSYDDLEKIVEEKKKFEGELFEIDKDTKGISYLKGMYDTNLSIELIKEAIFKKIERLNENYTIFKTNGLYIYAQILPVDKNKIKNLLENINNYGEYKYYFDIYFINCIDELIVYDCSKKTLKIFDISDEVMKKIEKEVCN
jgi:hypothetical protein